MFRFFVSIIGFGFLCCGCQLLKPSVSEPKIHFERSWARKTTDLSYFKQRNQNRMKPILHNNLVIQGNGTDKILAFDKNSGHIAWELPFENGVEGGATVADNKLFFGANDGHFYAVDVNSGAMLWKQDLKSESVSEPLVQGNYVYHTTANNALYAFEANSGRILWVKTQGQKSDFTLRGIAKPVFHNGKVLTGFSDGTFKSFDAISGNENWSIRLGDDKKFTDVDATAIVTDYGVLVASFANALYCIDPDRGSIKWSVPEGGIHKVLLHQQNIYYPTAQNSILVIEPKSGKVINKIELKRGLASPLTGFNQWIIFTENNGGLAILDSKSYQILAEYNTGRGAFAEVTVDEEPRDVYFISNDANLYKLKIKTQSNLEFPWRGTTL